LRCQPYPWLGAFAERAICSPLLHWTQFLAARFMNRL
jgi:hypothetical protein